MPAAHASPAPPGPKSACRRRHYEVLRAGRVLRLYTKGGPIEIQIACQGPNGPRSGLDKVRLVIDSAEPTTLTHAAKPRIFPRRKPDTQEPV